MLMMRLQVTGTTELSPVSVNCLTSSTQLELPVKLKTITGDVHITATLELNVSTQHTLSVSAMSVFYYADHVHTGRCNRSGDCTSVCLTHTHTCTHNYFMAL